jgi:hypothetical protein
VIACARGLSEALHDMLQLSAAACHVQSDGTLPAGQDGLVRGAARGDRVPEIAPAANLTRH